MPTRVALLLTTYHVPPRSRMYADVIRWWLERSEFDVYVVDSANRPFPPFPREPHTLHFSQSATVTNSTQGELESLSRALSHFPFQKYDGVLKLTGKYIVPDLSDATIGGRCMLQSHQLMTPEGMYQFSELFYMPTPMMAQFVCYARQQKQAIERSLHDFMKSRPFDVFPLLKLPPDQLVNRGIGDFLTTLSSPYVSAEHSIKTGRVTFKSPYVTVILTADVSGGSDQFVKCLSERYSYSTVTLRAQSATHMVWSRHGKSTSYSVHDVLRRIRELKFSKLFINHTLGIPDMVLRTLISMSATIYSISHDYNWLFTTYDPTFKEFTAQRPNLSMQAFRPRVHMLCQCQSVKRVFDKHDFASVRVVRMPDFTRRLDSAAIAASIELRPVCIGAISYIKGAHILHKLASACDLRLIGSIAPGPSALTNNPYSTIEEFNRHLERQRPNVAFFPVEWPETYSYTLTLCMLTKIPVIVKNAPFEYAITERLRNANLLITHDFDDVDSLLALATQVKTATVYPIDPASFEVLDKDTWDSIMAPYAT